MEALRLLKRAREVGLTVRADGDFLEVRGRPTPEAKELVEMLREHKLEVLTFLQNPPPGYTLKYPGNKATDEEIAEVETTVNEAGYILLWSTVLGDLLAFIKDGSFRGMVPAGIAAYSLQELRNLFGGKRRPSVAQLRLVHETKKQHGARIIGHGKDTSNGSISLP